MHPATKRSRSTTSYGDATHPRHERQSPSIERARIGRRPNAARPAAISGCVRNGGGGRGDRSADVGRVWEQEQFPDGRRCSLQWSGLEETHPASLSAVPDPENYLLTLNEDGTFEAKADCNRVSGKFVPTTLAACPPHSLSDTYIHLLGQVASYGLQQSQLRLDLKNNTGSMFFHAGWFANSKNDGPGGARPGHFP